MTRAVYINTSRLHNYLIISLLSTVLSRCRASRDNCGLGYLYLSRYHRVRGPKTTYRSSTTRSGIINLYPNSTNVYWLYNQIFSWDYWPLSYPKILQFYYCRILRKIIRMDEDAWSTYEFVSPYFYTIHINYYYLFYTINLLFLIIHC